MPIVSTSTIVVAGERLQHDPMELLVGGLNATISDTSDTQLVALLPIELRAGVQSVQVKHGLDFGTLTEPHRGFESNVVAFVLHPVFGGFGTFTPPLPGSLAPYTGTVEVTVTPVPQRDQRIVLLLNRTTPADPPSYAFTANSRTSDGDPVVFPLENLARGEYFVRVQVDGAESPLDLDPDERRLRPAGHDLNGADWQEANQRYLVAHLGRVREALERYAGRDPVGGPVQNLAEAQAALSAPAALDRVSEGFGLSEFERDVLLLCAGMELDGAFAELCGGPPTFGLALAALPGAHWSALRPDGPLRLWRLVETLPGERLTTGPLQIEERVLHYLAGVATVDERLRGLVRAVPPTAPTTVTRGGSRPDRDALAGRRRAVCGRSAVRCRRGGSPRRGCVGMREGRALGRRSRCCRASGHGRRARAARQGLGARGRADQGRPTAGSGRARRSGPNQVGRRLHRTRRRPANRELGRSGPQPDPTAGPDRCLAALGGRAARSLVRGARRAGRRLRAPACHAAVQVGRRRRRRRRCTRSGRKHRLGRMPRAALDRGSTTSRSGSSRSAAWDDLVLPEPQLDTAPARSRSTCASARTVYERLGLRGAADARGLGITALFAGASGTGKTMAAEVLANELGLDLYRIDLERASSASTSARRRRTSGGSSTPPRTAARSSSSTRPTRSSASAARSRTATTATRTSRSATCCSAWRRTAAWRS